jgi:cell division protein FtsL
MATWAARVEEPAASRPAPRVVARERRVTGGVVWIAIIAALLAGVVATNVAVLRLNMTLDEMGRDRADLRAKNAALAAELSSAAASPRIQTVAAGRLGLVQASSEQTTYVRLPR